MRKSKMILAALLAAALVCLLAACIGLWLFLRGGMPDYLFFQVPFAFLDDEKAGWLVLAENLLMLTFWAFIGAQAAGLCRKRRKK